jgi:RimJ/RimL family protein N-acetyltransferase
LVKELLLRDGTPAMIWTLSPNDGQGLQENFKGLSQESRYNRFLSSVASLSDGMLRRLVDDVDGQDHQALLLVAFPGEEPEVAVGVGRLVRYQDDPETADVAVTVKDDWQGRGVATALLHELIAGRPAGVHKLLTFVAASNTASLRMLERLGELQTVPAGPNILEVRVELA